MSYLSWTPLIFSSIRLPGPSTFGMAFMPDDAIKFAKENGIVSSYGWHAKFDQKEVRASPPKPPRLKTIAEFTPMAFRYLYRIYIPNKKAKTMPFMDPLNPIRMESMYGVPLGGIGCGTIGRGFKGEFCRSSLRPGIYNYKVNVTDQFIVSVFREGQVYQKVLSPHTSRSSIPHGLLSWEWGFPADRGHYIGLYPRSWTIYELPEVYLILICEQISPVIPHNYKDSCLPVGVFQWTVLNFHPTQEARVSITLTWRGPRYKKHSSQEHGTAGVECCDSQVVNASVSTVNDELTHTFEIDALRGCLMETYIGHQMPCCFGVAAAASNEVKVTCCPGFQCKAPCRVSSRGRLRRSNSIDANLIPSSPVSSSSESQQAYSQSLPRAHTQAPLAARFWKDLKETGLLNDDNIGYRREGNKKRSPNLVMAVCATCIVPPPLTTLPTPTPRRSGIVGAGSSTLHFFVTWHIPRVHFRSAIVAYRRRYTRWFSEDIVKGTKELLAYAAGNWRNWRKAIIEWQSPILSNPNLPDWYKSALFNELYFISDGGTVWLDPLPYTNDPREEPPIDAVRKRNPHVAMDPLNLTGRGPTKSALSATTTNSHVSPFRVRTAHGHEMGLFAYLEGHEYRMFNTYDVHFNASWALIELWPKIELAVLYDLVDMTVSEDSTPVTFIYKGLKGPRNAPLGVPHDCGDPEGEPWVNVNAYIMYPTDNWKDLSPKFILMAWRDWKITGDDAFLHYVLPVVLNVVQSCLEKWDADGDGIIENSGFPDQTYDTWKSRGLSAYVGGLWVAALYATHDMLKHVGNKTFLGAVRRWPEVNDNLSGLLKRAKSAYHNQLWGGEFYRYDSTTPSDARNNSVMADQLSGYWFLRMGGAPVDAILPVDAVMGTLKTIVRLNWLSVRNGKLGAINSVFSSAKTDNTNMQAEEFWVAVNYGLAALLILHGKSPEGFRLAGVCFEHVYNHLGLHFQTPEAFTKEATYRSLGYMRPLAIWSIQRAIKMTHPTH
ncbi:bile acid beta glucosidase [Echinococcus multilocularis]|uniref:Bile acid beta glucosidase n=1 Tax=Echinococcus multilocularis TaxID=6211 RepID=A0A068Y779_ECHMU|nr:bile acid beta glucosidase [Echinococcus multilocularis]